MMNWDAGTESKLNKLSEIFPSDPGERGLSSQARDFYQKVYSEYSNAIVGFFCKQGYTQEEAHDGLQDVYLRVIRLCEPAQLADSPKAYLLKVATNLMRDRYRKQAAVTMVSEEVLEMEHVTALDPSPERKVAVSQQLSIVRKAIQELSQEHREIFLMHRIEGLTCKQIAESLNVPLRTVQRRLGDTLAYCAVKLDK